ncbi:cellulose-growth-specific protein [Phlyctema vagabunda]|uniref:lytic cellulose monooxygenase (C4-dehydrogenating) n=1 Tax=Phlyctema vagabunda TaxID=108571 RepID=A0ABR4PWY0_9HELO
MKYSTLSAAAATALAATVSAHGYVDTVTAGGTVYTGYLPYQDPYTSPPPARIIRPVQGNGPITDISLIDLQCGGYTEGGISGSSPANLTAGPVAAGSSVSLTWTLWPESHVGPMITYMAKCPSTGCSSYLPGTDAVWFKVAEGGREGTSNVWADTPFMTAGASYTYKIPSCIAAGDYIVRHEIIALHSAYEYPGAQFYPSCHQISVTGGGSTTPAAKVAFPGAYSETDPGIVYDSYAATTYTIPGPALFTC